ncbi:MAG TPA: HAD family hydrolase [Alphaproteobacteria bacterium]|nr:HAD family hydrolase [Alphaproteobacteria bacterium]
MTFDVIAFDGDDTLWHCETFFQEAQAEFQRLLAKYCDAAEIDRRLVDTERRNLQLFGYGIKGFTLSMVETAITLTEGRIAAADIHALIELGKAMLRHPVEVIPEAEPLLQSLQGRCHLMIVTKGDLWDQQRKVDGSGLKRYFDSVEIVAEKDEDTYRRIVDRRGTAPERFVMIGNSLRSDILPVAGLGGHAIYVPYHITWAHEAVEEAVANQHRFWKINTLADVPEVLRQIGEAE